MLLLLLSSPTRRTTVNKQLMLLGMLRACYHLHWTAHWQSQGPTSFSDHKLFEMLYTGLAPTIDALAEKIVCEFGADAVDPMVGQQFFGMCMDGLCDGKPNYVSRSLAAEQRLMQMTAALLKDEEEQLSYGMEDLLNAMLNERETAVYLLKARMR